MLPPGVPFPLLVQVGLDVVDEGAAVLRPVVGVYRETGPFVHQEDLVVLVDNGELRGSHGEVGIVLPWLVKEFVIDIQLQHISRCQPGVPFGPGAIELDPLDADIFLSQGGGQQRHGLSQEPVQALARVVGPYGQFFHCPFPIFEAK